MHLRLSVVITSFVLSTNVCAFCQTQKVVAYNPWTKSGFASRPLGTSAFGYNAGGFKDGGFNRGGFSGGGFSAGLRVNTSLEGLLSKGGGGSATTNHQLRTMLDSSVSSTRNGSTFQSQGTGPRLNFQVRADGDRWSSTLGPEEAYKSKLCRNLMAENRDFKLTRSDLEKFKGSWAKEADDKRRGSSSRMHTGTSNKFNANRAAIFAKYGIFTGL